MCCLQCPSERNILEELSEGKLAAPVSLPGQEQEQQAAAPQPPKEEVSRDRERLVRDGSVLLVGV